MESFWVNMATRFLQTLVHNPPSLKHSACFIQPECPVCLEACQIRVEAGDSEGSEVNRKSEGLLCGRKGRDQRRQEVGGGGKQKGGGSSTWIECVRSMWECCQHQLHSRSEFKLYSFMPLCFSLPLSLEMTGFSGGDGMGYVCPVVKRGVFFAYVCVTGIQDCFWRDATSLNSC